jgi:hypothetical protein
MHRSAAHNESTRAKKRATRELRDEMPGFTGRIFEELEHRVSPVDQTNDITTPVTRPTISASIG